MDNLRSTDNPKPNGAPLHAAAIVSALPDHGVLWRPEPLLVPVNRDTVEAAEGRLRTAHDRLETARHDLVVATAVYESRRAKVNAALERLEVLSLSSRGAH